MKIAGIIQYLESIASPSLQESYDNAGLITGNADWECSGAIVSLDATESVVLEAIEKKCNLVIAHHPIVFKGLTKITGANYVEKTIITAIKNDIAIFAIHTNLDSVQHGVNGMIADKLGLINTEVLAPKPGSLRKLQVFVPAGYVTVVQNAIFTAGAGHIGNYSECGFTSPGNGTFKPGEGARPFVGEIGKRQQEAEMKLESIFPASLESSIITALKASHPYEEVAYDILPLHNTHPAVGAGIAGELAGPMDEKAFLELLKAVFGLVVIRHTALTGARISRVAACGGSGSFLIPSAIAAGAQVYITADVKYHEFFDASNQLVIADIGHYESEQFTIDLLTGFLREKFPTFAALKTGVKTNPVHYFL